VWVFCSGAHAQEITAGQLYAFCASTDRLAERACTYFIYGAVEGLIMADGTTRLPNGELQEGTTNIFCMPTGIAQSTMVKLFKQTSEQLITISPQDLDSPAVAVVAAAMRQAFPCRQK
jgi:hypothetical protein